MKEHNDPAAPFLDESANTADTDFRLKNLPYGAIRVEDSGRHPGAAIGDQILDLIEFTGSYTLRHHAFNVRCLFRGPANALPATGYISPSVTTAARRRPETKPCDPLAAYEKTQ